MIIIPSPPPATYDEPALLWNSGDSVLVTMGVDAVHAHVRALRSLETLIVNSDPLFTDPPGETLCCRLNIPTSCQMFLP